MLIQKILLELPWPQTMPSSTGSMADFHQKNLSLVCQHMADASAPMSTNQGLVILQLEQALLELIQKKLDSFHITKSATKLKTKTGKLDILVLCKPHSPMVMDNGVGMGSK